MKNINTYKIRDAFFVNLETGKKINVGNASVSIENEEIDCNNNQSNFRRLEFEDTTFTFEPKYLNTKKLYQMLYGITNNYRRLHDGYALREVTRRRYIMKHRRQVNNKTDTHLRDQTLMCVCKHKYIEQFGIQCNYYITYLFVLSQALISKFKNRI